MIKRSRILLSVLLCFNLILAIASPVLAQTEPAVSENETTLTVTISTPEQLIELSKNCILDSYSHNLTVLLAKDIDLSGIVFSGIPTYNGTFDGCGYTISGLNIDTNGSVQGMFRYLRPDSEVRNLNIEGVVAPGGSHRQVGGLAGRNAGKIINCSFSGEITGADCIGGLVGLNELTGIIENCTVSGLMHGDHFIGGVAGENRGVIRLCKNSSNINVSAAQNSIELGDIAIESLTGSESAGTATDIGGISGTNSGVIRGCTNNGTIGYKHIGYNVGGIAGSQTGYITDCKNYGAIFARKEAGGIVGQMEPSVLVTYNEDTLQLLHTQLSDMSGMINSTSSAVQNGYGNLSNQVGDLQGQIDSAMDAMGQLAPGNQGTPPDPDSTNAALNNLGSALSGINGTINGMSSSSQDAVAELTNKLGNLIGQINKISNTLGNASQGLGGTVEDISDADTDEDTSGKVENCINIGAVAADINAGGIVGAMSHENDLDPEDDLTISGNSSLNFQCETRAVVLHCENRGNVSARKQNAGGIAGYMMLGLVSKSGNIGAVNAPTAKYVGGIAGLSSGFIRRCWSKSVLAGSSYVGGVAGQSDNTVTDCLTMTDIHSGVEKLGEVLGYADKLAGLKNEENFARNYYLAVGEDAGGVDGISYNGAAQSMDSAQFFALSELPDAFDTVTLTFIFENGSRRVLTLTPGASLDSASIPVIPEKQGHTARWDGLETLDASSVNFDTVFTAVYDAMYTTLQSDTLSDGKPVILALGSFAEGDSLQVNKLAKSQTLYDRAEFIDGWEFSVSGERSAAQLRLKLKEDIVEHSDRIQLSIRGKDGAWRAADSSVDGSYLAFAVEEGDSALQIDLLPENYLFEIIAAGVSILLLLAVVIISAVRKRRSHHETPEI